MNVAYAVSMFALVALSGCSTKADSVIVALGNEPFWSVRVTAHEILYKDPEHQDGYAFPRVPSVEESGARVFRTRREVTADDPRPRTLELRIRRGSCSDGMSDREYPLNAQLKLDDETRTGCAYTESPAAKVPRGGP